MAWELTGNNGTNPNTNFLGTTDNQPLVIKAKGVGIGTTQPLSTLSIASTAERLDAGGEFAALGIYRAGTNKSLLAGYHSTGEFAYIQGMEQNIAKRPLVLQPSGGNVGIGTTQPGAKLEINAGDLLLKASADDSGDIIFQNAAGAQKGRIWSEPGHGAGLFLSAGNNIPALRVNAEGTVSIGRTAEKESAQLNVEAVYDYTRWPRAAVIGRFVHFDQLDDTAGIRGIDSQGHGVQGQSDRGVGVEGISKEGTGVYAESQSWIGMYAKSQSWTGVHAVSQSGVGIRTWGTIGVWADGPIAGHFEGPVQVIGPLIKTGGGFKIDHPLDPANKYLNHSFVESPDMKNVYDGVVTLNVNGEATIELPEWFEELNQDFRYQLTAIGAPGPNLHIAEEIANNRFRIAGGVSGMKVSWQVTGVRKDVWAQAHVVAVEEEKPNDERGHFLHPELYNQPEERGLMWARYPEMMRAKKEQRQESSDVNQ